MSTKIVNDLIEDGTISLEKLAIGLFSDVIKTGTISNTSDDSQSYTFDTPFVNGVDNDIQVVVARTAVNASSAFSVVATTKSGFTINRENSVSGTQVVRYIAINKYYTG